MWSQSLHAGALSLRLLSGSSGRRVAGKNSSGSACNVLAELAPASFPHQAFPQNRRCSGAVSALFGALFRRGLSSGRKSADLTIPKKKLSFLPSSMIMNVISLHCKGVVVVFIFN